MDYHLLLADRTVQIVRADNCSSAIAPRQPLLRCPTTVHPTHMDVGSAEYARINLPPWTYAISALPPSLVVG
jgi:hypothetical protein